MQTKPTPKACPIVLVEWLDAWHSGGTKGIEAGTKLGPVRMSDVGFMLSRTKKGVTLAGCHDVEDDGYNQVGFIPAGMISKVTVLKK